MRKTIWVHPDWPLSKDYFWMTPLADLLLFTVVGLLLFALGAALPRLRRLNVTVGVFVFLCLISWLTILPWFAWYAQLALALGMAVQAGNLTARFGSAFSRGLMWTTGWTRRLVPGSRVAVGGHGHGVLLTSIVFLLLVLVGTGTVLRRAQAESTAFAQLPAATSGTPNVLLVVWDTVRAMNMGLHGYERDTTPFLSARAENGIVFENAIAPSSWTLPSHGSMFTGRWHHEMSTNWFIPLNDEHTTLSEVLSSHGYATAGFASNTSYCTFKHGLDRGFLHFEGFPVNAGQTFASSAIGRLIITADWLRNLVGHHHLPNGRRATVLNDRVLEWLDEHDERPYFVFLNYFDAHEPVLPPEPFHSRFAPRQPWGPFLHLMNASEHANKDEMTPEQVQVMINRYDGAIAYLDDALETLLSDMEARGMLDNTLVIVTSDHGEHWGEKGIFDHGRSLYQELLHVPLVLFPPGEEDTGYSVATRVSLRDIPATVMEYLDLPNSHFPGQSLTRFSSSPDLDPDLILAQVNNASRQARSIIQDSLKFIRTSGDEGVRRELFNLQSDPREEYDLSEVADYRPLVTRLDSSLSNALSRRSIVASGDLATRAARVAAQP